MNARHINILKLIRAFFGVGTIFHSGKNAGYRVGSIKELISVIIPHFIKYPLLSTKTCTFNLWSKAIHLIHSGARKTDAGFMEILSIYAGINRGPTAVVKTHFPNLKPALLPPYSLTLTPAELSGWWISGYFTLYCNFGVSMDPHGLKNSYYDRVVPSFNFSRSIAELPIITLLASYFEVTRVRPISSGSFIPSYFTTIILGLSQIWILMFLFDSFYYDPYLCFLFTPLIVYNNADLLKVQIISENKGKSGIYCWKNLISDRRYIGSSSDLKRRLQQYFNINYLNQNTSMRICRALLKYGYSNFCLEILEYCDHAELLTREKYYFELFNPEYNICKEPGITLGKTHLKETKIKMSAAHVGEKNSMFGKPKPIGSGNLAKAIKVLDKVTNETTYFNSINEAAQTLNIRQTNISQYLNRNQKKPYKGRYIFSIV